MLWALERSEEGEGSLTVSLTASDLDYWKWALNNPPHLSVIEIMSYVIQSNFLRRGARRQIDCE